MTAVVDFPPPFRRMLALNSDIEFTTWQAQLDLIRLFGERGLETAFSYWMFSDPTYTWRFFEADGGWSRQAPVALGLARSGVLDTLHSFGGAAHIGGIDFDRAQIAKGYRRMEDMGVRTTIYTNHGTDRDVQNIGGPWSPPRVEPIDFRNYWAGDLPGHERYHLDLTLQHGVRYFWLDVDRARHRAWFTPEADTPDPGLFTTQVSRDGSPILRFKRTDFNEVPWPTTFAAQLDKALSETEPGYSVVFNHFGFMRNAEDKPVPNPAPYFNAEAFEAIERLMDAQRSGDTLVTTTSRLLNHAMLYMTKPWTLDESGDSITVRFNTSVTVGPVEMRLDWPDLMGFTLLLDEPRDVELRLGAERRTAEQWKVAGRTYAGIPWRPLNTIDALDDALRSA